MRAMICRQWGGPEDLRLEEVKSQPLKAGQVRIKIQAAGVSFATTLVPWAERTADQTASLWLRHEGMPNETAGR